ncbi:hypothetical protein J2T17_006385 [Paenibacillus mucilaginosus]|uniref:hypothetical protein n=1 Tax=Paenibacillus mucilaginosus TaxID=61624 RepID=UPI003D247060
MRLALLNTSLFCLILVLAGCSPNISSGTPDGIIPQTLKAEMILPDRIDPMLETSLGVKVTDNGDVPDTPTQISMEIWHSESPQVKTTLLASPHENGMYQATAKFDKDGVYFIRTVVNHNNQTIMPVQRFIVGKPSDAELSRHLNAKNKEHTDSKGDGAHQHDH